MAVPGSPGDATDFKFVLSAGMPPPMPGNALNRNVYNRRERIDRSKRQPRNRGEHHPADSGNYHD